MAVVRKRITIVLGVVIALIVILVGVTVFREHQQSTQLRKVSDAFVANVLADNPKATYEEFTKDTKQNESLTTWTGIVDKTSAFFHGSSATYLSTSTSTSDTEVNYSITGSDGKYTFSVRLESINNTWRIATFTSKRNDN